MRRSPSSLALSALPLATLLWLAAPQSLAEEITLASEPVCPYVCADGDSGALQSPPGIVIEIIRDAFSLYGHQIRYELRPLTRAIREVQVGHLDAALTWEANVPGFVLPQEPVVTVDTCFFKRQDDPWHYRGIASLEGKRLGIILGDHPPLPDMEAYLAKHEGDEWVQTVAGSDASLLNIRKLLAGRIDLFFDEKLLTQHRLRELGQQDQVALADCPATGQKVYLALSPANPKSATWARQLSEGIRKLRASGRIKQIRGHYGVD